MEGLATKILGLVVAGKHNEAARVFLKETRTTINIKFLKNGANTASDQKENISRDIYSVTIMRGAKKYSYKLGTSIRSAGVGGIPTEYAILSRMQKENPGNFHDFCRDFGYDKDSRSAFETYNSVKKEYGAIIELFPAGSMEFEALCYIN